jgi:hypothetical protein
MSILGLFRGGGKTSSDSPNGLVRNDGISPVLLGENISIRLNLRENIVVGGSGFTVFEGLELFKTQFATHFIIIGRRFLYFIFHVLYFIFYVLYSVVHITRSQ